MPSSSVSEDSYSVLTDGCEPPCGCWDLNSGPLEEQSVLLSAESSLQPVCMHVCMYVCMYELCM